MSIMMKKSVPNGGTMSETKFEYLRLVTPVLITVAIFMLSNISKKVEDIDVKLFRHLTNDEMHTVRSETVKKSEFEFYQKYREAQMADLKDLILDIRTHLSDERRMDKK